MGGSRRVEEVMGNTPGRLHQSVAPGSACTVRPKKNSGNPARVCAQLASTSKHRTRSDFREIPGVSVSCQEIKKQNLTLREPLDALELQCYADGFEILGNPDLEMNNSKYPQVPSYLPAAGLDPCAPISYQRLAPDDGNRRPARVHPRGARGGSCLTCLL